MGESAGEILRNFYDDDEGVLCWTPRIFYRQIIKLGSSHSHHGLIPIHWRTTTMIDTMKHLYKHNWICNQPNIIKARYLISWTKYINVKMYVESSENRIGVDFGFGIFPWKKLLFWLRRSRKFPISEGNILKIIEKFKESQNPHPPQIKQEKTSYLFSTFPPWKK